MKLLIPINTLDKYKSRDQIPLECEICKITFYRNKNDIQWALKCKTKNCLKVCGKKCQQIINDKRLTLECYQCGTSIKRQRQSIAKSKFQFCSSKCSATYWNSHKTWGSNRSKLEMWIEQQLTTTYPNLPIEYNKTDAINAELDIYIPSLKLAFELNGIFHYEPIFGIDKLKSFQTNDARKFQSCMENGIGLCVIDTSSIKYFKEERGKKFLSIITQIIDKKVAEGTEHDSDAHLRHV